MSISRIVPSIFSTFSNDLCFLSLHGKAEYHIRDLIALQPFQNGKVVKREKRLANKRFDIAVLDSSLQNVNELLEIKHHYLFDFFTNRKNGTTGNLHVNDQIDIFQRDINNLHHGGNCKKYFLLALTHLHGIASLPIGVSNGFVSYSNYILALDRNPGTAWPNLIMSDINRRNLTKNIFLGLHASSGIKGLSNVTLIAERTEKRNSGLPINVEVWLDWYLFEVK